MRTKGSKNLKDKPWEAYGLTKSAYYKRKQLCLPFDAELPRGRPPKSGRFSGKIYKNTDEKLMEIKEKYKNGITQEILDEMMKGII